MFPEGLNMFPEVYDMFLEGYDLFLECYDMYPEGSYMFSECYKMFFGGLQRVFGGLRCVFGWLQGVFRQTGHVCGGLWLYQILISEESLKMCFEKLGVNGTGGDMLAQAGIWWVHLDYSVSSGPFF